MNDRTLNVLKFTVLAGALAGLAGCATTSDLNNATAAANKAQSAADSAMSAANKAQATANDALAKAMEAERIANDAKASCKESEEKCSRMFNKSMQK